MVPNNLAMTTSDISFLLVILGGTTVFFGPLVASVFYVGVEYVASLYLPERWPLIFGAHVRHRDHGRSPGRRAVSGAVDREVLRAVEEGDPWPLLEAQNLSVHFGGLAAVKNVTFGVEPGERLALIGPNGAGKTTLFNLLTGQLKPSGGKVFFKGQDITNASVFYAAPTWGWPAPSRSPACSRTRASWSTP